MDPLTIGFEDAFHSANAASGDPEAIARLVEALRAILDASPHRIGGEVRVEATSDGRVELHRGGETLVVYEEGGRWRLDAHGAGYSGPVAAALTEWLTR